MRTEDFYRILDLRLEEYFCAHKTYICCKKGCSLCCEKGDYPLSQFELQYLMSGYAALDNNLKIKVQNNIKGMERGGACPFLVDKICTVYPYRPVVCRIHGLAYLYCTDKVKVPYCANESKNYSKIYASGEITINPVQENLDTPAVLKDLDYGEIRNLYDWIYPE